jgi:chemotaxis protein CheD
MNDIAKVIKVGIADINVAEFPDMIRTSGLGSCVGVVIFDSNREIAGMAHIMLPDSSMAKSAEINHAKYADTAIPTLVTQLLVRGARKHQLKAKIAGGAQMFQFSNLNEMMRIGPRNVVAVKSSLGQFKIELVAEDVGGNSGRTIEFNPRTKMLEVRTVNQGIKQI